MHIKYKLVGQVKIYYLLCYVFIFSLRIFFKMIVIDIVTYFLVKSSESSNYSENGTARAKQFNYIYSKYER